MKNKKNWKIIAVILIAIGFMMFCFSFIYYFNFLKNKYNKTNITEKNTSNTTIDIEKIFKTPKIYVANSTYISIVNISNTTLKSKIIGFTYKNERTGNIYIKSITEIENGTTNETGIMELVKYNNEIIFCLDNKCYFLNLTDYPQIYKIIKNLSNKYNILMSNFIKLIANKSEIKCKDNICYMTYNIGNDILEKYTINYMSMLNYSENQLQEFKKIFEMYNFTITGKIVTIDNKIREIQYNITIYNKNTSRKIEGFYTQNIIPVKEEIVENIIENKYYELKNNATKISNPLIISDIYLIYMESSTPKIF